MWSMAVQSIVFSLERSKKTDKTRFYVHFAVNNNVYGMDFFCPENRSSGSIRSLRSMFSSCRLWGLKGWRRRYGHTQLLPPSTFSWTRDTMKDNRHLLNVQTQIHHFLLKFAVARHRFRIKGNNDNKYFR